MVRQIQLQEQDLWEAWVEFDQCGSHFGTLYVWGEYPSVGVAKKSISTRRVMTDYGAQLIVQLPARSEGSYRTREYFYSEEISYPAQYHSICIYAGEKLVARLSEIEIMI